LALDDIRVVELCDWMAGPHAARLLADLGADVIKIELPGVLSSGRTAGTPEPSDPSRRLDFVLSARNKRSVTLDIRTPRGREIFLELIKTVDVLVENFRPGTMERWGLQPEVLEAANPRLVMLRISGFGQTGPWANRPGFDRVAQAFGGLTYLTGMPDGPPVRAGMGVVDYGTGMLGAFGVLAALHERARSGRGQVVDLALYETVLSMHGRMSIEFFKHRVVWERTGNQVPGVAPGDVYQSSDGVWLQISASSDAMWGRLTDAVGMQELLHDERLATNSLRSKHAEVIDEVLRAWVRAHTADAVEGELSRHGVACSRVMNIADIVAHPQVIARGNFVSVPDPIFGEVDMIEPLPKLSRTPGAIRETGPALGQHTEEVLAGLLGLEASTISELRSQKVI
jgi:succinyl-CoA--D-citramalate CoA-transferase